MDKLSQEAIRIVAKRIRQACDNSDHFNAEPLTASQIAFFRLNVLPTLDTLSKRSAFQTLEEKERLQDYVRFEFN